MCSYKFTNHKAFQQKIQNLTLSKSKTLKSTTRAASDLLSSKHIQAQLRAYEYTC